MEISETKIINLIEDLVIESPDNYVGDNANIFDQPLVGFCDASNKDFEKMKNENILGMIFKSPAEWMQEARTIISFFLPFSSYVRQSNYQNEVVSKGWLHGRFKGEEVNNQIRRFLVNEFKDNGYNAISPLLEENMLIDYEKGISSWSERHVAHIVGLGTFGLNGGLITNRGVAGRIGSIITSADIFISSKKIEENYNNCLYMRNGKCGVCIKRCPSGAITEKGVDKKICLNYLREEDPLQKERVKYGYAHSSCGKCQTKVPCEAKIP